MSDNTSFKYRINFIIEYFYPEIGGLEKSTERLALQFVKWGYFVRIITKHLDNTDEYEEYNGIHIVRLGNEYIKEASEKGLLSDVAVNCVFGVGHNIDGTLWFPIFEVAIPSFIKIGTSGDMVSKGIPPKAFEGFDAVLCQNPDLILETAQLGVSGLIGRRIRNGMDIEKWTHEMNDKAKARYSLNISLDSFVISAVGRLVKRKNFPLIIQSFRTFCEKCDKDDSILAIHGSDFGQHDGEEVYIRELIDEFNQANHSKIILVSPDNRVSDTLSASDVFVTMGEREGAPNIIIEAMASGCPIVASNISGHQVYVHGNGFLVDLSSNQISEKLYALYLNKELREKFAKHSIKNAKSFDIACTAKDYLDIFCEYGLEMKEYI